MKNDTGTFPRPELDLDTLDDGPLNFSQELSELSMSGKVSPRAGTPTIPMFQSGTTPPGALAHHGNTMSSETSHILKRKSWGDRQLEREREREEEELLLQARRASSKVCLLSSTFPPHLLHPSSSCYFGSQFLSLFLEILGPQHSEVCRDFEGPP